MLTRSQQVAVNVAKFMGKVIWVSFLLWVFLVLVTACAHGQTHTLTLPDSPKPSTADKKFWLVVSTLAAAKTADAVTTSRVQDRGGYETNPIYGWHPSPQRIAITNAAALGAEVGLAYIIKRYGRNHWWGRLWAVHPIAQTGLHMRWAIHNERLLQ